MGLRSGRVELMVDHAAWAAEFLQERQRILQVLAGHATVIEHVGSTAVPGVPAKPILDILVGVLNFEKARICIKPMEWLGYEYRGEYGIPGRHYFVKGAPRTHHLHMLEVGGERWGSMVALRDALLACPDIAHHYAEAKLRLAAEHRNNRAAYQRAKDRVIEHLLEGTFAHGKPIDKVIAYITRGPQLLVFSQPDFPDAGVQVPGGSVEADENPRQAVLREAQEETGLDTLELTRFLGKNLCFSPDRRFLLHHYFHLTGSEPLPDEWDHWENSPNDGSPPVRFRFWWADLARVPKLSAGRDALVEKLSSSAEPEFSP